MNCRSIHEQLRRALEDSGLSEWELARRANVRSTLVSAALEGNEGVPLAAVVRLARALDSELTLTSPPPEPRIVGSIPSVVDGVVMRLSPERVIHSTEPPRYVLALGLEGTLISNDMHVRPGLFRFLTFCRPLFCRIVMFTTVKEALFRKIARTLVERGSAPSWFADLEYVPWSGPTKDLTFVPSVEVDHVLLVDDLEPCVHPGQQSNWVPIKRFQPPFVPNDAELERILEELAQRVLSGTPSARE